MVDDVLFRKSTRTFFSDRLRRTFWWNFDEFNNHGSEPAAGENQGLLTLQTAIFASVYKYLKVVGDMLSSVHSLLINML
jgi:hypothetical protein